MKRLVRFNINEPVRVRLTDLGREIHLRDHTEFVASLPPGVAARHPYRPPDEDADGFWSTSAWHLMQLFGPHIYLGAVVPFETTVEFEVDIS